MSPLEALGLFIGIPAALAAIIFVLVSASSWTRSGRTSGDYDAGPLLIASDAALPDPARLPSELAAPGTVVGGGISARW